MTDCCCICFESEGTERLECCRGFLHEDCKQRWFLETSNCRSYECRVQGSQSPMERRSSVEVQFNVSISNGRLRYLLLQSNRLQARVAQLQTQNTEYRSNRIDMQSKIHDLKMENRYLRAQNNNLQYQIEIIDIALTRTIALDMCLENCNSA